MVPDTFPIPDDNGVPELEKRGVRIENIMRDHLEEDLRETYGEFPVEDYGPENSPLPYPDPEEQSDDANKKICPCE